MSAAKPIRREARTTAKSLAGSYPILTVTGPRQSGKTTLCQQVFPRHRYVSLETPDVRRFALEDPRGFLDQFRGRGVILDEIQRAPELPSYLQERVDADPTPGRIVLTGSHQFELMRQVSQSLAGRTAILRLLPLSLKESARHAPLPPLGETILRGFYPRIVAQNLPPAQALADYFATYLARDLRDLAAIHDLSQFERFVRLCAGRVGQLLNLSNLGNDAGVSHTTARAWIDLLQQSYVVYLLPPWFTNTRKRLVKSPKLYFYDVGLAAWLLNLRRADQVTRDPAFGALFENLVVIDQLKNRFNAGDSANFSFYRDAIGNEIDLVIPSGRHIEGIECKAGATVNPDYFRGFKAFDAHIPGVLAAGRVIFGGDEGQARSVWPVQSWRRA
jgi:uncharacterized protein